MFDEKRIEDDSNDNTINHNINGSKIIEYAADHEPQHNYDDDVIKSNDSLSHQYNTNNNSRGDLLLDEDLQRQQNDNDLNTDTRTAPASNDDYMDDFNDDYAIIQRESSLDENSSTSSSVNRRHNLHLDLNLLNSNNNCLPLLGTNLPLTCTTSKKDPYTDEQNNDIESFSSPEDNANTTEHLGTVDSCSSTKTKEVSSNAYCLSPNSTDEPTTPTLATTINDIIFHFSDDSLDNL